VGKGRKPKPTALKIVTGNPGKRKLNEREPKPGTGRPPLPAWLDELLPDPSEGQSGKEARSAIRSAWERVAERCEAMGVLTVADGVALEVISVTLELYRSAVRELIRDGQTCRHELDDGTVKLKRHPAVGTAGQWATLINALLAKFGLTPSDRVKLVVADEKAVDPFEAFLAGGKKKA
jgi:P27 family predicted phage terminase small subunit